MYPALTPEGINSTLTPGIASTVISEDITDTVDRSYKRTKLLTQIFKDEAEDHEELTAPLLATCSVSKEVFKLKASHISTYQIVGVQHFTAILRLNELVGSRKITTRRCAVYGKRLSPEGLLALAQQYNQYKQIQRSTTFP